MIRHALPQSETCPCAACRWGRALDKIYPPIVRGVPLRQACRDAGVNVRACEAVLYRGRRMELGWESIFAEALDRGLALGRIAVAMKYLARTA